MRINVRLLLITFLIVAAISITSSLIFYSLSNQIIYNQQTTNILNSLNQFVFNLQANSSSMDDEFEKVYRTNEINTNEFKQLDFIIIVNQDGLIYPENIYSKNLTLKISSIISVTEFQKLFPNLILNFKRPERNKSYFYGKVINDEVLSTIAIQINADIALIYKGNAISFSHKPKNEKYLTSLNSIAQNLVMKNNYDLEYRDLEQADIFAAYYKLSSSSFSNLNNIEFIVFSTPKEGFEFRSTLKFLIIIIISAGAALSLVFVLLFTTKFRKQISLLTNAVEIIKKGDIDYRVKIVAKDELGNLGTTFNAMLDELVKKENAEKDYAEFIALINKNPTLKEIADAALYKIINTTKLTFGILSLVENDEIRKISSYGLIEGQETTFDNLDIYKTVIEKEEIAEFAFTNNHPVIKTGLTAITVHYIIIAPIIYNNRIIAVLELASDAQPKSDVKTYLNSINEQLAVGLANAEVVEELEKTILKLKELNENYQIQNKQIKEQNNLLLELHEQLKEKADELEKERERAFELSRVKSQFLANMSHELKTPLNSILGLSEIVLHDPNTKQINKDRLDIVLKNGKKLLNLIINILEFSKLDSGKLQVNNKVFLLNNFINEMNLVMQPLFNGKNVKFVVDMAGPEEVLISTDKEKLEHVLSNLISNAAKFTTEGSVTLRIGIINEQDVYFEVSDTGEGISENDQERIFDEFEQSEITLNKKTGGAGLGLAIVRRYLELLNSRIRLISQIGSGSTFSFKLDGCIVERIPISEPRIEEEMEENDNIEDVIKSPKDSPGKTILVVDDDTDTLFTVGEIIKNQGYNAVFAKDGIEAIEKIAKSLPDLVLLDIRMPRKDGFQTIKEIRQEEKFKDLYVIALTAHAMIEEKDIISKSGFDDLVTKPVNSSLLISKIDTFINLKDKGQI